MRIRGLRTTITFLIFAGLLFWAGKVMAEGSYKIFSEYFFYGFTIYVGRKGIYALQEILKRKGDTK